MEMESQLETAYQKEQQGAAESKNLEKQFEAEEKEVIKPQKVKEIVLELTEPIEWGNETISRLKFRRLKAKEMRTLSTNPKMGELLDLAQKSARVPRRVIDELDSIDAMAVVEVMTDFLDVGQEIGKTRSF